MKIGDYVRLSSRPGAKVYQITASGEVNGVMRYMVDATADHPDAARRVPDYFRSYTAEELVEVRRR